MSNSTLSVLFGVSAFGLLFAWFKRSKGKSSQLLEAKPGDDRFKLASTIMGIGLWTYNFKSQTLYWDTRMFELYELDPVQGPPSVSEWFSMLHPDDRANIEKNLKEARKIGSLSMRFRVLRMNDVLHFRTLGRVTFGKDGSESTMTGITWDITNDVRNHETIEEQKAKLASSARLASLGEMASGVAHEINNPLQIIIGQASMMRSKMSRTTIPPEEIAKTLEKIETTADRIALIVKGLRTVAREGNQDPYRRTNLMSIVNDALSLCTERIRGKDITLETNLSEIEGLQIDCRSVQISQILLNLLTNAYHAVEGSAERWIRLEARVIDSQVEFAVVDSGTGILPEHRSKIFQPFFTTKDVGRGTGLGLSISLSIARDHEGDLYLDPTSSNTRFVLKLPLEH